MQLRLYPETLWQISKFDKAIQMMLRDHQNEVTTKGEAAHNKGGKRGSSIV